MSTAEVQSREPTISPARKAMVEEEEEDLRSWVEGVGQQEMKFRVTRISPKFYKGVLTEGFVANYEEPVYEDQIRENHGGGYYKIAVTNKRANGQWKYFTTRQVKIPGNPRIDNLKSDAEVDDPIPVSHSNGEAQSGLAARGMDAMQRMLEREQERADRARNTAPPGMDYQLLQQMNAPLLAQLEGMQRQMMAKDAQILQLLQKPETPPPPPGGTFEQKILGNMLESESSRLETLRERHASELRQLKEGHQQDLNRVHDAAKEELRVRERQHERELDMLKDTAKNTSDTQKTAMDMRIDSLKSEISRLTGELAAAKVEVAELRAKKDKTLPEQADEIMRVQEAFKSLGVGGAKDEDDDSDKPWYERMAGRVMENPEALGQMLGGVRGAIAPAPAAPQPQLPPVGQPFQTGDGHTYVVRPDNKVQRLNPARRAKAAAAAAAVTAAKDGLRPPDASEMKAAIEFMQSAAANGTTPEAFAASARTFIDGGTLAYVEKVGIDELLNQANLDPGSVLRQQAGRNWARAVTKILLEGAQ